MKHVKLFEEFIQQDNQNVNEGIGDTLRKAGKYLKIKFESVVDAVKKLVNSGKVPISTEGPKKGAPMIGAFSSDDGDIVKQIEDFYRGTEFAEMGNDGDEVYQVEFIEGSLLESSSVPLNYPTKHGAGQTEVRNVTANELAKTVIQYYKRVQFALNYEPDEKPKASCLFIYGAPGIGKTAIVGQAAKKMGINIITIDVHTRSLEDLLGLPENTVVEPEERDEQGKLTKYSQSVSRLSPPQDFYTAMKSEKGGILFLDELNRTDQEILNKMLNFIDQGRLGDYRVPHNWLIVCAGNRAKEIGGEADVANMFDDDAVTRRFNFINFSPDPKDWIEWGRKENKEFFDKHGVYLMMDELFDWMEKDSSYFFYKEHDSTGKYPNPDSWTRASIAVMRDVQIEGFKSWKEFDMDYIFNIFMDEVGYDAATSFTKYLTITKDFTDKDFDDIVKRPKKARLIPMNNDTKFALIRFFFNNVNKLIDEKEAQGINLANDPKHRGELVAIYRNLVEYFSRYGNLEDLIASIKEFTEANPIFKYSVFRRNPSEKEKEDLEFINNTVTKIKVKTFNTSNSNDENEESEGE